MNINEIKENPENPRKINEDKFEKLVKSIKEFPEMLEARPLVIDENNVVLGGNMRLKALREAGIEDVPVKQITGWSDKQKKEFIVKDNKSFGEWDWDMLSAQYDVGELVEWGFDEKELGMDLTEPDEKDDEVPETPEEPKSKLGDLYELGEHRVLCGDSTQLEAVLGLCGDNKMDMVFTDPPWNVNYGAVQKGNAQGYKQRTIENDDMSTEDFSEFMNNTFKVMNEVSKDGTPTYVVMSAQEWGNMMLNLKMNDYHWSSTIIWAKDRLVLSRKDYHTQYEPIWYGWKDGTRLNPVEDRKQSDLWKFERPSKSELHPTTKPIELVATAIQNSSKREDRVLDLFLGSGSTLIASEKTSRICYGMELDPKYVDVIVQRYVDYTGNTKIKKNGEEIEWETSVDLKE